MAETNILSITLKEYKQEIDSLKGSLLGLEKGSEEYEKIAQQVRDKQQKLNEVLADTKKTTSSAANSMNELKDKLKEMKQEVGNLDVGSERFKELSKQILETTNKLKDLEATQGTFSRNVGNYAGGVIEAFDKMGISVKGLQGAFNIATSAGQGFNSILTVLKAHPIITALTILSTIIYKVYDSIENSEKATNHWNVALSSFRPIMDAFNNIMEKLALILVDVVDWIGKKMPSAIKYTENICTSFVGILGNITKGFYYVKDGASVMATSISKIVGNAISGLADKLADVMDFIPGMDKITAKIKTFASNLSKTVNNMNDQAKSTLNQNLKDVDNWVQRSKVGINEVFDNWTDRINERRELAEATYGNELNNFTSMEERKREQELLTTQYEKRENELRDKIAKASGAEKIRLAKELNKVIAEDYSKRIKLAKDEYEIQKKIDDLAPNSIEDNQKLFELKKNIANLESGMVGAMIKNDKLIHNVQISIAKNDEQREKAQKAFMLAETARIMSVYRSNEKYNGILLEQQLKNIDIEEKAKLDSIIYVRNKYDSDYDVEGERVRQVSNVRSAALIEFEDKRYAATLKYYTQELNEAKELANKKDNNEQEYNSKVIIYSEKIKQLKLDHEEYIKNVALNNVETIYNAQIKAVNDYSKNVTQSYWDIADSLQGLNKKSAYTIIDKMTNEGLMTPADAEVVRRMYDTYWEDLQTGHANYYINLEEQTNRHNEMMLEREQDGIDKRAEIILASDERYTAMKQELAANELLSEEERHNILIQLVKDNDEELFQEQVDLNTRKEEEEARHNKAMAVAYKKDEQAQKKSNKNKLKNYLALATGMGNLFGTIGDIMEDDIRNKQENGKITEEEAKKQFETVKILQIANATVSTIAGSIGAFMDTWKDETIQPVWVRGVLAGINATTVTAAGIAQIAQLKAQQFNASGSVGGTSAAASGQREAVNVDFSGVRVNPLLDEQSDINRMTTVSGDSASEYRVVILQSDIAESMQQVEIRQSNTTF